MVNNSTLIVNYKDKQLNVCSHCITNHEWLGVEIVDVMFQAVF